MTVPTAGERCSWCSGTGYSGPDDCTQCDGTGVASPPDVAASTGTSEDVETRLRHHLRATTGGLGVADLDALLAAREAAARAAERERIAQADRCGGCKGQGSHRRHCPRHPNYHPWIPLADRAESIGDSIGEPGLANQAWALAAAIRDETPNHPYWPVRHREAR